jgi:hypothetical protein
LVIACLPAGRFLGPLASSALAAARYDASGDYHRRTTDLPGSGNFTFCAWININTLQSTAFFSRDNTSGGYWSHGFGPTGAHSFDVAGDIRQATTLAPGTWHHLCATRSGNDHQLYLNGNADGSVLTTTNAWDNSSMSLGAGLRFASDWFNGRIAAVKIWDGVALSQEEIQNEMRFYRPRRSANLHIWSPMLTANDAEIDYSGNGRNWMVGGTITTEDGPPIGW